MACPTPRSRLFQNFVLAGNKLILVTDSNPPSNNAVAQLLQALDGGNAQGSGGSNGATTGLIVGQGLSTNGPFGSLPNGSNFATSINAVLTPGSHSTVLGTNGGSNYYLEIAPGALGPGSGAVLATGDVMFMNFF